jgi:hypothetical protein
VAETGELPMQVNGNNIVPKEVSEDGVGPKGGSNKNPTTWNSKHNI